MLYGWFTRIMNRPKKVNAVDVGIFVDRLFSFHEFAHEFLCGVKSASVISEYPVKALRVVNYIIRPLTAGKSHSKTKFTDNGEGFSAYCAERISEDKWQLSYVL